MQGIQEWKAASPNAFYWPERRHKHARVDEFREQLKLKRHWEDK